MHRGVIQRGLDALALAAAVAVAQRHHDPERGVRAGEQIDRRRADPDRRPAGLAGDAHVPRVGLQQLVIAGPVAHRPGLAEARHAAVDHRRGELAHRVVADAEPVGDSRLEALDHDVRGGDEPADRLLPGLGLQVDGDARLVAVQRQEQTAELLAGTESGHAPAPRALALARLHLDHLGAEVAEQHRTRRSRHRGGEVDDPDAVQRQRRVHEASLPADRRVSSRIGSSVRWTSTATVVAHPGQ